jgi:5-hydroxydodecatetraenal polyketide synthase CpkA
MTALAGQVVILTGATGGFGRAAARALAQAGADLLLTARDRAALDELADALRGGPARVRTFPADLTDQCAADDMAAEALRCFGGVDALVNNAAVLGPTGLTWELDEAAWWQTMETNLRGTMRCCRAVLPTMIARGGGRIVNIASNAGRTRWPLLSAYSVSKGAVIKLSENLAQELARHGVAVFAYHPGLLNTGLTTRAAGAKGDQPPLPAPAAAWVRRQLLAGAQTPLSTAAATLLHLLDGAADRLSGRYLTADEDIPALVRAAIELNGSPR